MIKTSNKEARQYVESRTPFKGSNTFGEGNDNLYVVYSYGYHYPLYIWTGKEWIGNKDKVSSSTSKQANQLNPGDVVEYLSTIELKSIADKIVKANFNR